MPSTSSQTTPGATRITGLDVCVKNVTRVFADGVRALDDVSLNVPPGQFVSILGPSGCGKSTLLRLVAGLDQPTTGTITSHAASSSGTAPGDSWCTDASSTDLLSNSARSTQRLADETATSGQLAFVFQDAQLLPWRHLLENVAMPLELRGVPRRQRHDAALSAIAQVGLSDAVTRYPNQLSGGMCMRASLARALVTHPRLLLLDEPFGALDELTRHRLHDQLLSLWQANDMTVLFVTHSVAEAAFLAQRAIVMSKRPGRIIHDGAIELPPSRTSRLRGTARFAEATAPLYEALERGDQ